MSCAPGVASWVGEALGCVPFLVGPGLGPTGGLASTSSPTFYTTDYGDAVEWARDRFSMPLEEPVIVDVSEVDDGVNNQRDNYALDEPEQPMVIRRRRGRERYW